MQILVKRKYRVIILLTIVIFVATVTFQLIRAVTAGPATNSNYYVVCISSSDCFINWDSESSTSFTLSTADWPVTIIYYGNAEVDKIKLSYGWPLTGLGNSEYLYIIDDGIGFVDSDRGMKTLTYIDDTVCGIHLGWVYVHVRLYADPERDYDTDPLWGHYVIATSHLDKAPFEDWSGFPSIAEHYALQYAIGMGWNGIIDALNVYNADPTCRFGHNGHHININDGYASIIYVPP